MIIGNTRTIAIESALTQVYAEPHFRALGLFVLHIGGLRFGVFEPDASMLACSLGEVADRLAHRGSHIARFAEGVSGSVLADAFRDAIYAPGHEAVQFFGMSQSEFSDLIVAKRLVWAPDGDEAFDDGSYVLHFDLGDQVRLVAFRCSDTYHHDPETLRDIKIPASEFYGTLQQWHDAVLSEWESRLKETPPTACERVCLTSNNS